MSSVARRLTAVAIVFVLSIPIFLYRLGTPALQNWDEAIHAEVSRELRLTHDWGTMHFADTPYFRKPPLKFWLTAASESVFGEHEWVTRMWSAAAGIATVVLLTVWVLQETGSALTAGLAGTIFLSGRFIFFHAFRTGEMDGMLTLFTVAALYGYWRAKPHTTHALSPGWLYLTGTAVGLAVMTKSAAGALPLIILGVDYFVSKSWRVLPWKNFLGPAATTFVIVAPWHVYESVKWGGQFWNEYLGLHVLKRVTTVLHNPGASEGWYGPILFKRFFPFSLWLLPAVVWLTRGWLVRRRADGVWLWWVVLVYLLFTLVKTKFDWYLLPLYPAAAVIVAKYLVAIRGASKNWIVRAGNALAFGGFVALLPSFVLHEGILWRLTPSSWLGEKVPPVILGVAAGVIVFFLLARAAWSKGAFWIITVPAVGFALVFNLSTTRRDGRPGPMRDIARWITEQAGQHQIFIQGIDLNGTPYAYYYLRGIPQSVLRDTQGYPYWIPLQPTPVTYLVEPKGFSVTPDIAPHYPVALTVGEYEVRQGKP